MGQKNLALFNSLSNMRITSISTTLLDYTNLFSPNHYQKNEKIIYKCFKDKYDKTKHKPRFYIKEIDDARNYFLEKTKRNDLMSKKYKKVCRALNYIQYFLIFVSAVIRYILISAFASLVGIPVGIAVGLKIYALTATIKKYKSIIKKEKPQWDSVVSKN